MKTRIIAAITALFFFAATVPELVAQGANNYIFFDGTGSTYQKNGVTKKTSEVPFEEQLNDAYAQFGSKPGSQVVVGHSMGGMRALAYAAKMKNMGTSNKLNAVISIAGPVQGFTPLLQGSQVLQSRVQAMINNLARGAISILAASPLGLVIGPIIFTILSTIAPGQSIGTLIKNFAGGSLGDDDTVKNLIAFLSDGQLAGEGRFISTSVLADFNPGSAYVAKYLHGITQPAQGHWAQVITGYRYIVHRPAPGEEPEPPDEVPIYSTVWIQDSPEIRVPPVSSNVAVGYVYGTDRSPINMLADQGIITKTESVQNIGIVAALAASAAILHTGIATAATAVAIGFWWNPAVWVPAIIGAGVFAAFAINAGVAAGMLADIDGYFNTNILCTNSSDAFIPVEAATRPLSQSGGQSASKEGEYKAFFPDNHANELKDPRIVGSDIHGNVGSLAYPQHGTVDGIIYKWLNSRGNWNENFSIRGNHTTNEGWE